MSAEPLSVVHVVKPKWLFIMGVSPFQSSRGLKGEKKYTLSTHLHTPLMALAGFSKHHPPGLSTSSTPQAHTWSKKKEEEKKNVNEKTQRTQRKETNTVYTVYARVLYLRDVTTVSV